MSFSDLVKWLPQGLSYPDFAEFREDLVNQYRQAYGADIVVEPSSQDGIAIDLEALARKDVCDALRALQLGCSPATAVGVDLSRNVKINGIRRRVPTHSTVDLVLTAEQGTVVENGVVSDVNGTRWLLPAVVSLGNGTTITVTATAEEVGAVTADPGTITRIDTPVRGWTAVTNPDAATIGAPLETDAELRARQDKSTMIGSVGLMDSIEGALLDLEGVTRVRGYENDTNATMVNPVNGLPSHSITWCVEGGTNDAVAAVIAARKTLGVNTWGNTSVTVRDRYNIGREIRFSRPAYRRLKVLITLRVFQTYTNNVETRIAQGCVDFGNALGIGESIDVAEFMVPAQMPIYLDDPNTSGDFYKLYQARQFDVYSIKLGKMASDYTSDDNLLDHPVGDQWYVGNVTASQPNAPDGSGWVAIGDSHNGQVDMDYPEAVQMLLQLDNYGKYNNLQFGINDVHIRIFEGTR